MIEHIISDPMCTKSLAAWKMMVFAASMVRAKHAASIPGWDELPSYGPTREHSGKAIFSHMVWKLPNVMTACGVDVDTSYVLGSRDGVDGGCGSTTTVSRQAPNLGVSTGVVRPDEVKLCRN
jgi:hypothetical protein